MHVCDRVHLSTLNVIVNIYAHPLTHTLTWPQAHTSLHTTTILFDVLMWLNLVVNKTPIVSLIQSSLGALTPNRPGPSFAKETELCFLTALGRVIIYREETPGVWVLAYRYDAPPPECGA